jgi:hypothetical protein
MAVHLGSSYSLFGYSQILGRTVAPPPRRPLARDGADRALGDTIGQTMLTSDPTARMLS